MYTQFIMFFIFISHVFFNPFTKISIYSKNGKEQEEIVIIYRTPTSTSQNKCNMKRKKKVRGNRVRFLLSSTMLRSNVLLEKTKTKTKT